MLRSEVQRRGVAYWGCKGLWKEFLRSGNGHVFNSDCFTVPCWDACH